MPIFIPIQLILKAGLILISMAIIPIFFGELVFLTQTLSEVIMPGAQIETFSNLGPLSKLEPLLHTINNSTFKLEAPFKIMIIILVAIIYLLLVTLVRIKGVYPFRILSQLWFSQIIYFLLSEESNYTKIQIIIGVVVFTLVMFFIRNIICNKLERTIYSIVNKKYQSLR